MKKLLTMIAAVFLTSSLLAAPLAVKAAGAGSTAGLVVTSTDPLTVRSSASTSSAKLTSLPKGSTVTLLSKSGSWWSVEYAAGKYGYCYGSYLQQVSGSYAAYVTAYYLNVRSGAGSSYGIQSVLSKGTGVVVLTQSGGWSRILYSGTKVGYVGSTYLNVTSSSAYPAIHLSVPSYKQTDSRWSSYPLGTTGNTIDTAGCLTTALSMAESYRTGTTITPSMMAAKSTYSAGGALYWPSNYSFNTNSAYLQTLYSYLKAGKPVLFGATGTYGQHWVVVTGYTGGASLTAANFTINDPGTYSRTNLQQLLNSYPTFYKLAYYR